MQEYKGAVFFDLDGTLLDPSWDRIPQSALRGIQKLKDRGYLVCLSTGRDMDTHYSRKYLDWIQPDAVIHLNGNKITIGDSLLFQHEMQKALLSNILNFAESRGYCVGSSIGNYDYYSDPDAKTRADLAYRNESRRNYADVYDLLSDQLQVLALSFAGEDTMTMKRIVEREFPMLSLYLFNNGTGADVVERGYSKAEGMRRICAYFGIPMENTYAFGDSPNDIEMLMTAGTGVAVGNAAYEVKLYADAVTEDIGSDGIYKALRRLGLIF